MLLCRRNVYRSIQYTSVQWRVDGGNREVATSEFFGVVPVMGVWVSNIGRW